MLFKNLARNATMNNIGCMSRFLLIAKNGSIDHIPAGHQYILKFKNLNPPLTNKCECECESEY
jgi:hypothetical protein